MKKYESYTTTDSYEIGTVITNAHHVADSKWDATALSVIENAGLTDGYLAKIPKDIADAPDRRGEFDTSDCECGCHKSGFKGFIDNIANAFRKLFRTKQICECGRYHY